MRRLEPIAIAVAGSVSIAGCLAIAVTIAGCIAIAGCLAIALPWHTPRARPCRPAPVRLSGAAAVIWRDVIWRVAAAPMTEMCPNVPAHAPILLWGSPSPSSKHEQEA
jgi:hypothetical protein